MPVALRRRLDISAGDDLEFEDTPQGTVVRVVHRRKLADFFGVLETEKTFAGHDEERKVAAARRAERHR